MHEPICQIPRIGQDQQAFGVEVKPADSHPATGFGRRQTIENSRTAFRVIVTDNLAGWLVINQDFRRFTSVFQADWLAVHPHNIASGDALAKGRSLAIDTHASGRDRLFHVAPRTQASLGEQFLQFVVFAFGQSCSLVAPPALGPLGALSVAFAAWRATFFRLHRRLAVGRSRRRVGSWYRACGWPLATTLAAATIAAAALFRRAGCRLSTCLSLRLSRGFARGIVRLGGARRLWLFCRRERLVGALVLRVRLHRPGPSLCRFPPWAVTAPATPARGRPEMPAWCQKVRACPGHRDGRQCRSSLDPRAT